MGTHYSPVVLAMLLAVLPTAAFGVDDEPNQSAEKPASAPELNSTPPDRDTNNNTEAPEPVEITLDLMVGGTYDPGISYTTIGYTTTIGLGWVGLAISAYYAQRAGDYAEIANNPSSTSRQRAIEDSQNMSTNMYYALAGGGTLLLGGFLWQYLDQQAESTAQLAPVMTSDSFAFVLSGEF